MFETKRDQSHTADTAPTSLDQSASINDGRILDRIVREAMFQYQEPPEMPTLEFKRVKVEPGSNPDGDHQTPAIKARGHLAECFKLMARCSRLWMQMRILAFSPSRRLRPEATARKREMVRELITCYERLIYQLHQLNLCDDAD